ncbi:S8 family serine peptidase [Virgibacillus sp. YIM 98842]|jgi:minor extracellular serine protease Vpr|uniref:S8 family serine peptidase n=1 Tax=Virgibacillus sp. YIM 98842 TaxID=2663533 RepID=UPI0013DBE80E|nr:S8 family serine peptidase [Virgibacillus sp. YIM 98842]
MRLYFLAATLIFFTLLPQTVQAETENVQSVIIEVEGNPQKHKAYIETYHPFIEVVATYDILLNGLALQGSPDKLERMETLEFIKSMHTAQSYETLPAPVTDAGELGENTVFPSDLNTTSYTGRGVKVAVIDTGIDYNHPDLELNYRGGYDLVDLDEDPMETTPEEGIPTSHGSHVAGIIAANGELQGVAPDAEIYAYRALGPGGRGTSVQVIAAMEKAAENGADVINLSLGNNVNGPDYPTSLAVNRAAELGISVVTANGNSGPDDWTVGSPAAAAGAFSVGAYSPEMEVPYLYESKKNREISFAPMIGSPPWDVEKAYPITNKEDDYAGKIALIARGETSLFDKAKTAEEQGAVAVIIHNNEEGIFQGSVQHDNHPISIPAAAISKEDGAWLEEQLNKEATYLETDYKEVASGAAPFSSRGPVTVNWKIKPDILAPGTNIVSTVPGGYQALQGTSMAAPHVTGAIALIKEARPDWTNEQIHGALKTTALRMKGEDHTPLEPIIQGMGEISPEAAIETNTIIYDPLLSFGKTDTYTKELSETITIENMSEEEKTYYFSYPDKQQGITWELPQQITLEAKEKREVPVRVKVTAPNLSEGVHQGWLTLNEREKSYHLPYLFVNQEADNPKVMGFEFSLKPFSDEVFAYQLYITDPARRVRIDLYDPDTLMFERNLLDTEDVQVGNNEGQLKKSEAGEPGHYAAIITVSLEDGTYESYQMELYMEPE